MQLDASVLMEKVLKHVKGKLRTAQKVHCSSFAAADALNFLDRDGTILDRR